MNDSFNYLCMKIHFTITIYALTTSPNANTTETEWKIYMNFNYVEQSSQVKIDPDKANLLLLGKYFHAYYMLCMSLWKLYEKCCKMWKIDIDNFLKQGKMGIRK